MRRTRGQSVLAGAFALLALNAWAQALLAVVGRQSDPAPLIALQALVGAAAAAAAWGSWTAARWAPLAALAYGIATAGMLAALPSLLALPADAWAGLWTGMAGVLVFAAVAAWRLRRLAATR